LKRSTTIVALLVATILAGHAVSAQITPTPPLPLASLKTVPIPEPDNLGDFVKDKVAAIALGKTLFWDMQVGSDGIQSCASCHFHAGVDNRAKNQISPGLFRVNADGTPNEDRTFTAGGPNYTLKTEDFPFHKLQDPNNPSSTVLADSNDVASSQGIHLTNFVAVEPGNPQDEVTVVPDPVFNVNGINVRQVQKRNSSSAINAVFNFRQLWDGRGQNILNGVSNLGLKDQNAVVIKAVKPNQLEEVKIQLENSSLASQAVGPPVSAIEMSGTGRIIPDIGEKLTEGRDKKLPRETGKKLRALTPLGKQIVATDDSVLGELSNSDKPGLKTTYKRMIKDAFKSEWWKSKLLINVDENGKRTFIEDDKKKKDEDDVVDADQLSGTQYTLMDYNFPLFMGLSIQMYEATLVSDNAAIDQYLEGNKSALTDQQVRGKELFEGKAKCISCHSGAELTSASVRNVEQERLKQITMADGQTAIIDNGFFNTGVRPTTDDLGTGRTDPLGNSLSESKLAQQGKFEQLMGEKPNITVGPNDRLAVDGAFKVPSLRNVDMTAPYFHNGGQLTLEQVVDFYNRGGDFNKENIANLAPGIQNLNLSAQEKEDLVAFLKALTDERVRKQSAPFDHPQLFIPNGHPGDQNSVTNDGSGRATDELLEIPAVGRNGGTPLTNFLATNS
jgi:cytochrome c peroxidase